MKGAVHHCIAADPGDRHQTREHHERRAAPDSGIGQRTKYSPLDLHHVSVPVVGPDDALARVRAICRDAAVG
jgi:hypothetical protein